VTLLGETRRTIYLRRVPRAILIHVAFLVVLARHGDCFVRPDCAFHRSRPKRTRHDMHDGVSVGRSEQCQNLIDVRQFEQVFWPHSRLFIFRSFDTESGTIAPSGMLPSFRMGLTGSFVARPRAWQSIGHSRQTSSTSASASFLPPNWGPNHNQPTQSSRCKA